MSTSEVIFLLSSILIGLSIIISNNILSGSFLNISLRRLLFNIAQFAVSISMCLWIVIKTHNNYDKLLSIIGFIACSITFIIMLYFHRMHY